MQTDYSFIILTLNEEIHLPRLLDSLQGLQAPIFVVDSGSTDKTLEICGTYLVHYTCHPFENHSKQWDFALKTLPIKTPWIIGLDADHILSSDLYQLLKNFQEKDHQDIDGIYFNRKYFFRQQWIRHGGHYPKYLLKMFRHKTGYSNLNENMDHRFLVPGSVLIWRNGILLEENLKENNISFWLRKHDRYSDLMAEEEVYRMLNPIAREPRARLWGNPDEHIIWLKKIWRQLPRYIRPCLYLFYRLFIKGGIRDGKTGILYHFLHSFWFRLIVDIKIEEHLQQKGLLQNRSANRFILRFLTLFLIFYFSNLGLIGLTSPGGFYCSWLDQYFNYVRCWRNINISISAAILNLLGYHVYTSPFGLHVAGRAGFRIVYSCLGYGILSVFTAFVFACHRSLRSKFIFLFTGYLIFQLLNLLRLLLIALYWQPHTDTHLLFNYIIYILLICLTCLWLKPSKHL